MEIFDPAPSVASAPSAQIPIDGRMDVDTYNTLTYGNGFDGNTDADGIVTLQFDADGGPLTLNLEGYDINTAVEVSVLVNGAFAGFLTVSPKNELSFTQLEIDGDLVLDGSNTLTFVQTGNPSATWGVTNLFLASPGLKELPFYYDPEFSQDGWVAWQVDHDGFYLGRMDMNTGGFLGVVNHIDIPPITWFETVQAVELINTPDGIAAIGMTEQGLVYLSATEAYILEGTEGMRFNAMPKGEVPVLRFVCADENNLQYLYDNGELTLLPLSYGQAWQWLDDDQVLMRNNNTNLVIVLNVETMTYEEVTNEVYSRGGAAAITTSTGEQMITMQGDGFRDIFIRKDTGWVLLQRVVSPLPMGDQFYSPEFFEWQGRVWLLGYLSNEVNHDWDTPTGIVLYDIDNDLWVRVSSINNGWKDPEVLVLNDGTLAWYADDTAQTKQFFNTISYETAMRRGLIAELFTRFGQFDQGHDHVIDPADAPQPRAEIAPLALAAVQAWRTRIADVAPEASAPAGQAWHAVLTQSDSFDFLDHALPGDDKDQDEAVPFTARIGAGMRA